MKHSLFIIAALPFILSSCYYDKFDDFKPVSNCDTTLVTGYAAKVKPILDAQCVTCHGGTSPSGGIRLDNYTNASTIAKTGKLLSSITWDGNAQKMPSGSPTKIDNCAISTIRYWITMNYPQ